MQQLLFTEAEWPQIVADVATRMSRHVEKYTAPISKIISQDEGEHCGSGSYWDFSGRKYLITNEHVARVRKTHSLATKIFGDDNYFRLKSPFAADEMPIDVAIARVEDCEWNRFPHRASAILPNQLAPAHQLAEGELLFTAGYSGERFRFTFGHLFTAGTPYLAREYPLPDDGSCDRRLHFALEYNPAKAISLDGSTRSLPLPPGLSGSLVWNTKVVEARMRGQAWSPDIAMVTGMVWGWTSGACLLATKAEHMPLCELVAATNGL